MDNPIRILHVIGIMNRGGAETMIMNLYRNIDRSKVQFDFVENSFEPAVYDEEILKLGGRIFRCSHYNGKNHFQYVNWWNEFFKEHKNEFVAVHGHIGSTAAIYLSIAKKNGIFTIAHSHNTKDSLLYKLFSYPTRYISDDLFACSKAAGVSRYGKMFEKRNSNVIKNAINLNQFVFNENVRKDIRKELNIGEDTLIVGHVGRFMYQKNHIFLLRIFKELIKVKPNSILLLLGDGELRIDIEKYINENNLNENVRLLAVQPNVNEYLQAMDVFVMPSHFEGLPVSMVEAQTSGLPCVVSSVIPNESKITDLVNFVSLDTSTQEWANIILEESKHSRTNRIEELKEAGYDIHLTAKWLENYYLNCSN